MTAVLLALSRKKTCRDGHAPFTIAKAQTAAADDAPGLAYCKIFALIAKNCYSFIH
jgi:hypothetical protein